jgi:16S rRNA (adenine1518-N6/adenine1519-N6)-dimethyltransferase
VQTLAQIRDLLDAHGLRPKRSLGQNFLIDHNLIRKLVDAAAVRPGDLVLEVGPGTGTMTEELLARGADVIACELDDGLAALNAARIPTLDAARRADGHDPFTLVHADCLDGKHALSPLIVEALAGRPFKLVSNLPYGAATPLLMTLLTDYPKCPVIAVTIQREVADRLTAGPGSKDYGPLGVLAQAMSEPHRVATAPPECFWPRPDVTSAMLVLRRRAQPLTDDPRALADFARTLFAQRRKQLGGVLKGLDWPALAARPGLEGLTPTLRAEQLTVEQIIALNNVARASSP